MRTAWVSLASLARRGAARLKVRCPARRRPISCSSTARSSPSIATSRSPKASPSSATASWPSATTIRCAPSPVPQRASIDLKGRTVIPGLMDNHLHGAGGGPGVDLSRARSLADVDRRPSQARVRQSKPGDVIVSNSDWHEAQLKEQRLPLARRSRHDRAAESRRPRPRRTRIHPQFRGADAVGHHAETRRSRPAAASRDIRMAA